MFHLFLKPLLGLVTVGGLATGSYFLYKHSVSKKSSESKDVDGSSVRIEEASTEIPTVEGQSPGTGPTSTAATTGTASTSSHIDT